MFVKNKAKVDFNYRKGDYVAVLKAGTVSQVDETKVSARELLACYGQRITVISLDETYEAPVKETFVKEVKVETTDAEKIKKEDLNDDFINQILDEIKEDEADTDNDTDNDTDADTDNDTDADTDNDTKTDTELDEVYKKAAEGVIAFLNGETDKLPDGTEVISEDEAKKLEGVAKEVPAKTTKAKATKTKATKTKTGRKAKKA